MIFVPADNPYVTDTRSPAAPVRLTDRGHVALAVMGTILAVILFRPAVVAAVTMGELLTIAAPVVVPLAIALPLWAVILRAGRPTR